MALTCLFVGPDDTETCDGCAGAVEGNPYDVEDAPQPGEFECMARCRHILQLVGDDGSDGANEDTFDWTASVGFTENPVQGIYDYSVAPEDTGPLFDLSFDASADAAPGYYELLDDHDMIDQTQQIFGTIPDPGDSTGLAQFILDTGVNPSDITDALDPADATALDAAYTALLGDNLTIDTARELLDVGDVEQLTALADDPDFNTILHTLADAGFDDTQAEYAFYLAEVIGGTPYIGKDGRWYLSLREVGTASSGNYGHAGNSPNVGGSSPGVGGETVAFKKIIVRTDTRKTTTITPPGTTEKVKFGLSSPTPAEIDATKAEITKNFNVLAEFVSPKVDVLVFADYLHVENGAAKDTNYAGVTLGADGTESVVMAFNLSEGRRGLNAGFKNTQGLRMVLASGITDDATRYAMMQNIIVDHEMGHVLSNAHPEMLSDFVFTNPEPGEAIKFSRYGSQERHEAFAEAYSGYLNKDPLLPPAWNTFFKKALKGAKFAEAAADNTNTPITFVCGFGTRPTLHIYRDGTTKVLPALTDLSEVGTASSGDYGHVGVHGQVGGSAPSFGVDLAFAKNKLTDREKSDPAFKARVDDLINTNGKAEMFNGTLYHGTNAKAGEQIVQSSMLNQSLRGTYGPGFYFATDVETARTYGSKVVEAHVEAKLYNVTDASYAVAINTMLDPHPALGSREETKLLFASALSERGYAGMRILTGLPYVTDFNVASTVKSISLGESVSPGNSVIVLFDHKAVTSSKLAEVGTASSGNYNRPGRPGQVGGSDTSGATTAEEPANGNSPNVGGSAPSVGAVSEKANNQFINAWYTEKSTPLAAFVQSRANILNGLPEKYEIWPDALRGLKLYKAKIGEALPKYEQKWDSYITAKSAATAKQFDADHPAGATLYRGTRGPSAEYLYKLKIGDTVEASSLLPTSDNLSAAKSFSGDAYVQTPGKHFGDAYGMMRVQTLVQFDGVTGKDVFTSHEYDRKLGGGSGFVREVIMHNKPSRPWYLIGYSDATDDARLGKGNIERTYQLSHTKLREVGTASSGNYNRPGRPGQVGGSDTSGATTAEEPATQKPGTHVVKVSEAEREHVIGLGDGEMITYHGFPTDTRFKNVILREIDKNIDLIPLQVRQIDEVFLTDKMTHIASMSMHAGAKTDLTHATGITISTPATATAPLVGFNVPKMYTFIPFSGGTFSISEKAKSPTEYARLVVDHEMGHVLYNSLSYGRQKQFGAAWNAEQKNIKLPPFTEYSASDVHEGFAEAYAGYVNKMWLPDNYKAYFEKTLSGHTFKEAKIDNDNPIAYLCGFGYGPTYHIYTDRVEKFDALPLREVGTASSGNYGHAGDSPHVGGSAPSSVDFEGTLYHATDDANFKLSDSKGDGDYGPGLYLSAHKSKSTGTYGKYVHTFEVKAKLLEFNGDHEYYDAINSRRVSAEVFRTQMQAQGYEGLRVERGVPRLSVKIYVLWTPITTAHMTEVFAIKIRAKEVGTASSGNYNRPGRPGQVGGSAPGYGTAAERDAAINDYARGSMLTFAHIFSGKANTNSKDMTNPYGLVLTDEAKATGEAWAQRVIAGDKATMVDTINKYENGVKLEGTYDGKPDFTTATVVSHDTLLWALRQQSDADQRELVHLMSFSDRTSFSVVLGHPIQTELFNSPRTRDVVARELESSRYMPDQVTYFQQMTPADIARYEVAPSASLQSSGKGSDTTLRINVDPIMWANDERSPKFDTTKQSAAWSAPFNSLSYSLPGHRQEWVMTHEMGHVLEANLGDKLLGDWKAISERTINIKVEYTPNGTRTNELSTYSHRNGNEQFAESYSAYRHGLHDRMPTEVLTFFRDRLKVKQLPSDLREAAGDTSRVKVVIVDELPEADYTCDMLMEQPPRMLKVRAKEVGGPGSGYENHPGRKGQVGGSIGRAENIAIQTLAHEGGSFSIHGEKPPTSGYMVGEHGYERTVNVDTSSKAALTKVVAAYMRDCKASLARHAVYLGTWIERGTIYLDNSHHIHDRSTAFSFAQDNNQLAVYNASLGKAEDTMTDGKRPSESKGKLTEGDTQQPPHKMFFDPTMDAEAIAEALMAQLAKQEADAE